MSTSIIAAIVILLFAAFIIVLIVVLIVREVQKRNRTLSFYDLSDDEQTQYMALSNAINTKLLEKFLNSLPFKIIATFVTMGTSLIFSGVLWLYRLGKNANAKNEVRQYIEKQQKKYRCGKVDWQSFPNSSLVTSEKEQKNYKTRVTCPICKKDTLQQFLDKRNKEILVCSSCHKSIVVERSYTGTPENIVIPGFYAIAIPASGIIADAMIDADPSILIDALSGLLDYLF